VAFDRLPLLDSISALGSGISILVRFSGMVGTVPLCCATSTVRSLLSSATQHTASAMVTARTSKWQSPMAVASCHNSQGPVQDCLITYIASTKLNLANSVFDTHTAADDALHTYKHWIGPPRAEGVPYSVCWRKQAAAPARLTAYSDVPFYAR
jgi:hypothetical protein